jgi:hypothetical protein
MVRRASSLQAIAGVFATDLRSWQLSLRRLAFFGANEDLFGGRGFLAS